MPNFRFLTLKEELDAIADPNHYGWCFVNNTIYNVYKATLPEFIKLALDANERPPWYIKIQDKRVPVTPRDPSKKPAAAELYKYVTLPTQLIGGPSPLSLSLVGALYGLVVGYLGKFLLSHLSPGLAEYINTDRLPLAGAIAGAAPGVGIGVLRALKKDDTFLKRLVEFVRPFKKESQYMSETGVEIPQYIDETHWRDVVLGDPFMTRREKALATAPFYAAGLAKGSRWVTEADVVNVAANTLLGGAFGVGLASAAKTILGVSPEVRKVLIHTGLLAGLVRGLAGSLPAQ